MQSMQRKFGKLMNKNPGDNARVSVLLKDYEDADNVLAKIIEGTKAWRDSWVNLVNTQLGVATEYEGLYDPIVGATDGHGRDTAPTPENQLNRTLKLKEAFTELKGELVEEISLIDSRLVKPAADARDCISPVRKTIKKRENKRLDYEKCQDKVNKLQRKPNRSAKDDAALARAEQEMMVLAEEFQIADAHLRETLPPIIDASFRLIPPLLGGQIMVQNRLLGLYYTVLHDYCEDQGFPSPAPPMEQVVADWTADFKLAQREVESLPCVARGRAIHQSMNLTSDVQSRKTSTTSQYAANEGPRRSSSGLIPNGPSQRPLRVPSATSLSTSSNMSDHSPLSSPRPPASPSFKRPDYLTPTDFTTATILGGQTPVVSPNSSRPRGDYFGRDQQGSSALIATSSNGFSGMAASTGLNGLAKKKPPPPPPPKRVPSTNPEEYVIAQYTFTGQGDGDLSFREGDRIKIVKKTDTDQDWWVGEIGGVRGSFPANYCKAT